MGNSKRLKGKTAGAGAVVEANPWPRRLALAAGVSVVGFLVLTVILSTPPPRGVPDGTEQVAVPPPAHVEGDIHADGDVPAGGPHSAVWQNCAFYDQEVRPENAVHSLEHGAVWITYRRDIAADDLDRLRGLIDPPDKVLISPLDGQEKPIVATAWANRLELESASDPRLEQFVNEFEGSTSAPEPGGSCTGGIG